MIGKYNLFNMMNVYNKNKDMIHAHLRGEQYEGLDDVDDDAGIIAILGVGLFLFIILCLIIFYVYAIVLLVRNWNNLKDWAKILGTAGLIIPAISPIFTYISVFAGKKNKVL